jgi:hypothetical protein
VDEVDRMDEMDEVDTRRRASLRSISSTSSFLLLLLLLFAAASPAAELWPLVERQDYAALAATGPGVVDDLVRLYQASPDPERKARIAMAFYYLGQKSEKARVALLADAHTAHEALRLQVQWALGRVSNDDVVVDTLLDTLLRDPNPLFREKAGCGLAYDQIHLTEPQKVALYERLIVLLDAPSRETRGLAIRILEAHTGQRKGYHPALPEDKRRERLERWHQWLQEYRAAVSLPS